MKKCFGFTAKRMIAYLISLLLPIAGCFFPGLLLFCKFCLNGNVLFFFIWSFIVAVLLACIIFSNRKKFIKVLLSIILLILFVIIYLFNFMFGAFGYMDRYEQEQVQEPYTALRDTHYGSWMPELTQVGETVKISYYSYHAKSFIFLWDADYLICSYEPEEYERQKANLENAYRFQTEMLHVDHSDCEPTAQLDGYTFRFVDLNEYCWFQHAPLIGYSDEANEIMYVNYYDVDRDVYTSLKDLLIVDCGWKYIR